MKTHQKPVAVEAVAAIAAAATSRGSNRCGRDCRSHCAIKKAGLPVSALARSGIPAFEHTYFVNVNWHCSGIFYIFFCRIE